MSAGGAAHANCCAVLMFNPVHVGLPSTHGPQLCIGSPCQPRPSLLHRPESTTFTVELPEPRTPDAQEPPRKQRRTAAADADSSCGEQRDAEQLPAGFHLLRTDGIPARANRRASACGDL